MWFNAITMVLPCLNKTHGHRMVGDVCTRCGMSRTQINALFAAATARALAPSRKRTGPKQLTPALARRTMHSEMHALAKDISEYCGEETLFAQFLGRIKTVGLPIAYQAFSELRARVDQRHIRQPGRWWMWKTKSLREPKLTIKK